MSSLYSKYVCCISQYTFKQYEKCTHLPKHTHNTHTSQWDGKTPFQMKSTTHILLPPRRMTAPDPANPSTCRPLPLPQALMMHEVHLGYAADLLPRGLLATPLLGHAKPEAGPTRA